MNNYLVYKLQYYIRKVKSRAKVTLKWKAKQV